MTKPKKKHKTGDAVGWAVVNSYNGDIVCIRFRREDARQQAWRETYSERSIHRIAKIVLAK